MGVLEGAGTMGLMRRRMYQCSLNCMSPSKSGKIRYRPCSSMGTVPNSLYGTHSHNLKNSQGLSKKTAGSCPRKPYKSSKFCKGLLSVSWRKRFLVSRIFTCRVSAASLFTKRQPGKSTLLYVRKNSAFLGSCSCQFAAKFHSSAAGRNILRC